VKKNRSTGASGSVTIYFIIATASFFLVTALLIDFARVAAFRKQAELSVKSGVRSVLSSYDPLIYAKYGLFIRGGEPANDVLRASLEGNSASGEGGTWAFLDTGWEQAEVSESRPIASHGVFRRQVLEEMKYKAPIDLTLEVAKRFRGVTGTMKEATRTVDLLEQMRKAYDRREKALDKAHGSQKKQGSKVASLAESAIGSAGGTVSGYEDYVSKRKEDESRRESLRRWEETKAERERGGEDPKEIEKDRPEGPKYGAEIAAYESAAVAAARTLGEASVSAREESVAFAADAKLALAEAKRENEEMRAIVARSRTVPSPASAGESGGIGGGEADGGDAADAEHRRTMEELRKSAEELVLPPEFFFEYESELDRQHAQALAVASETSAFGSSVGSAPGSAGMGASLKEAETRAKARQTEFSNDYGPAGGVLMARREKLESRRSHDAERKRMENQAKTEWSAASSLLSSFGKAAGSEEEREGFACANELYKTNLEWNEAEDKRERDPRSDSDPSDGRDAAMASANGLLGVLEDTLLSARDRLYFSEYAIGRLSHFDPSSANALLKGTATSLDVHAQETEYVLYGLTAPAGNVAASYGELFAFRLAVRTMEGLIECRAAGHPLLVLAAALVYGITKAAADLAELLNTGKIQLSKYLKVDTYYTDYLRLFLLAHGGSDRHAARAIALMEHASGLDFRGAYTYASAEGTASVRLWFFPGLLEALGRAGNLGGTVKGNRYEATYSADFSYQ